MKGSTMRRPKRHKRGLNPPWNDNHIGRYSLEEIALEFILWEDAGTHGETSSDAMRKDFIKQALDQSFARENRSETLHQFLKTYERLFEKIYQRQEGNHVKENIATPEHMRQLFHCRAEKHAA
jgi:hypothetical protein